jgi:outer membrane protein TolC
VDEWDARLLCCRRGLTTYLEVPTHQTIQLADERAAALVARRIIACAQLQLALGGNWNTKQLPGN